MRRLSVLIGKEKMFAPPTTAMSQSPARSPRQASCSATSDDEQVELTVYAGPVRSYRNDRRDAANDATRPGTPDVETDGSA